MENRYTTELDSQGRRNMYLESQDQFYPSPDGSRMERIRQELRKRQKEEEERRNFRDSMIVILLVLFLIFLYNFGLKW